MRYISHVQRWRETGVVCAKQYANHGPEGVRMRVRVRKRARRRTHGTVRDLIHASAKQRLSE